MNFALVFLGGGAGAVLRYALGLAVPHQPFSFPLATLLINVAGSFLIGICANVLPLNDEASRLLLMTGLLGGFTTFSAFSLENAALWQAGLPLQALGYSALTLLLCFSGVALGLWLGRIG